MHDEVPLIEVNLFLETGHATKSDEFLLQGFGSAFFKVCLVLIFLNTIVEKHTLNPEITLLYQFHAQKYLFKVP